MPSKTKVPRFDPKVKRVVDKFLINLNTPISLSIYLKVKYGCWDDIADFRLQPIWYLDTDVDHFRRDYAAASLLRKYEGLPLKRDRNRDARVNFHTAEVACKRTNMRLSHLEFPVGIPDYLLEFLHKVRKVCSEILGPIPSVLHGRFGPGTLYEYTSQHGLEYRNPCGKIMSCIHATPSATAIVELLTGGTMWRRSLNQGKPSNTAIREVPGNRFTTAPKDAASFRGICVECSGNMFAQLAVGGHIRHRLLHVAGIDLDHGQILHQEMAKAGSITNDDATIDVRQASDTVARMCVKLHLAYAGDWFLLLDCLRSPKTRVDGVWQWLQKFSSMGNGFTFELETLLFYAIALVASREQLGSPRVKVYGDDIIVPAKAANDVLAALQFFGFTPNEKKTFVCGPFRESCGGDYFMGERVTPFYMKTEPLQPSDWITIANGLYDVPNGVPASLEARSNIGLGLRIYGPKELGDIVIHERDRFRWTTVWRYGIRWVRAWVPVVKPIPLQAYPPRVQLASALYGVSSSGPVPRDAVAGYRYRWKAFS